MCVKSHITSLGQPHTSRTRFLCVWSQDAYFEETYTVLVEDLIGFRMGDGEAYMQKLYDCFCANEEFNQPFAEHFFEMINSIATDTLYAR